MARRLLVVATLAIAFIAGGLPKASAATRYVDQLFTDVVKTENIKYGEAVNAAGALEELKLDLYKPAGDTATDRPLYIYAHGGNFREGDKQEGNAARTDLVRRGWVAMSINYRVDKNVPAGAIFGVLANPQTLNVIEAAAKNAQLDMQAAVRYARLHAGDLGIDPNKIAVGGFSAGGIMALMVAFNPKDPPTSGNPGVSSAVAAAVSYSGAYLPAIQGALPAPGAPPVAMYHGTNDEQVPYPTAPVACVLTLAVLNDCEFVTFFGEGHQTMGTNFARDFLYRHVILGRGELHTPLVAGPDASGTASQLLAGVEPPGVRVGASAGLVVPKDPQVIVDETIQIIRFAAGVLGIALPI